MRLDYYQKALEMIPDNKFFNSICHFVIMIDYIFWAFQGMNMTQKKCWTFNLFFSTDYCGKWNDFTISYSEPTFDNSWGMFNPPDYPVAALFAWSIFLFHLILFIAIAVIIYGK